MQAKFHVTILVALLVAIMLSGPGANLAQADTVQQEGAIPFQQIPDRQTLAEYQAYLAGFSIPATTRVVAPAARFEQIADRQALAEYHAYLAGYAVPPSVAVEMIEAHIDSGQ